MFEDILKGNEEEPAQNSFSIFKTDDDKRLVFGWASIALTVDGQQLEDRQHDIIDPEDLEEAAYEYVLNFRDTGEEHIPTMRKKGKLVESCVLTAEKQKAMGIPEGVVPVGWWIGFKIDDDDAWNRVKTGHYKMFSIEGKANRLPVEKGQRDYDEYPSYSMWLEENLDATMEQQKAAKEYYQTHKEEAERNWKWNPDTKPVAKSFDDVLKFNPYHDRLGRFASANGGGFLTFSANPNTKAGQLAIDREKQRQANAQSAYAAAHPPKPQKSYDKLGYADYDDADYHQLYNGRQYYQQQQLTAKQQQAATNYLEDYPEPGSLYSHSQNMNYMMATGQKLTGKYKQTHDGLMDSMHNVGYNVELTRYDHDGMVNGMLKSLGAGNNYERMTQAQLQKALVGQSVSENKFLSTSYNNFKNAPQSTKQIFDSRAVKINYKVKADAQGMMPGKGGGGDFGEIILAPTNGTANRAGKITDVRLTGQMVRRKGTQIYNQPRIEIDIEI